MRRTRKITTTKTSANPNNPGTPTSSANPVSGSMVEVGIAGVVVNSAARVSSALRVAIASSTLVAVLVISAFWMTEVRVATTGSGVFVGVLVGAICSGHISLRHGKGDLGSHGHIGGGD